MKTEYKGVSVDRLNPLLTTVIRDLADDDRFWNPPGFDQSKLEVAYWTLRHFFELPAETRERIIHRLGAETVPVIAEMTLFLVLNHYWSIASTLRESVIASLGEERLALTHSGRDRLIHVAQQIGDSPTNQLVQRLRSLPVMAGPVMIGTTIPTKPPPPVTTPAALGEWWETITSEHPGYLACMIFLLLPSDEAAIQYVKTYSHDLHLMSGNKSLIIAFTDSAVMADGLEAGRWNDAVTTHIEEGHSLTLAAALGIPFDRFPCLVLSQELQSSDYLVVPLAEMSTLEISRTMRILFSVFNGAAQDRADPLVAVERWHERQRRGRHGKGVVAKLGGIAARTVTTAVEAWIRGLFK